MKGEAGHVFLARLGKKRLRPGGKAATDWLMSQATLQAGVKVLEVACNQGTTLIELARRGCRVTGLDLDESALLKARQAVEAAGLADRVTLQAGDARALPFEDGSFDLVVNEAMLTMLPGEHRKAALAEYYRVLRPGGRLLTHDVAVLGGVDLSGGLSHSINHPVSPESPQVWEETFKAAGFSAVEARLFPFSLMTPSGMIRDEGLLGALKIFWRGRKKENREQFQKMRAFFAGQKDRLRAIAVVSTK